MIFGFYLSPAQVHAIEKVNYITQNGGGSKTGRSLANVWAILNFNTANWSINRAVDGKIGSDDVVNFYGTFTERIIVTKSDTPEESTKLDV